MIAEKSLDQDTGAERRRRAVSGDYAVGPSVVQCNQCVVYREKAVAQCYIHGVGVIFMPSAAICEFARFRAVEHDNGEEAVMLSVLGHDKQACDGVRRRDLLTAVGVGMLGEMALPQLLRAEGSLARQPREGRREQARRNQWIRPGQAKSAIFLNLFGGPPHQDMFDLKPHAPDGIRGEFQPIATSVPGIDICELLPRAAKWMHRSALIRTVTRAGNDHNAMPMQTGYSGQYPPGGSTNASTEADPPSMGSVYDYLGLGSDELPAYVFLPCYLGWGQAVRRPGQYGGFLGRQFDPLMTECVPTVAEPARYNFPQIVRGRPALPNLNAELHVDRLDTRRTLLQQLDQGLRGVERTSAIVSHDEYYRRAFNLLTSSKCREAFDLARVDPRDFARYGNSLFGESTLIARRLIEAGPLFVTVVWECFWRTSGMQQVGSIDVDPIAWDTHYKNFDYLRDVNCPQFDQIYSSLMEDLEKTGLLDETLVVVMGEMGRAPKINKDAGRDHWTHCSSVLLSGAGIRGGMVYGESDKHAAYPAADPVSPADVIATIYHCLGIDPQMPVFTPNDRPIHVAHGGQPIRQILT